MKERSELQLNITHLYPEHMNLYGDLGNVTTLKHRSEVRGIDVKVTNIGMEDELDGIETDIYFFGGGQDNEQLYIYPDLLKLKKSKLLKDLNEGVSMLAICGGYQLLGEYFLDAKGNRIEGIGFLSIETVAPGQELKQRAIGNLVTKLNENSEIVKHSSGLTTLVGFENHSGRTRITKQTEELNILGIVLIGEGDNEDGISDGIVYKNTIASYMHGSLLPKNPHLADYLIKKALEKKYNRKIELKDLDDSEELNAHRYMLSRYNQA
jgi:lipid II isoglutaminyl synthase (glutamine-hydrolysing)